MSVKRNLVSRLTRTRLLFPLLLIVLLLPALYFYATRPKETAAWWNESWIYRKRIDISNPGGSDLTDFQVSFTLDTTDTSKFQDNCEDLRVTGVDGNLLPFWIEENNPGCGNASTKVWVKIPSIPSSGTYIYAYYGNPSASVSSDHDGNKVFEFFDDFESYSIGSQPTKFTRYWGAMGSIQSDGTSNTLKLVSDGVGDSFYRANTSPYSNFILEVRAKDSNNAHFWVGSNKEGTTDSVGSYIYPGYTTVYYRTGQQSYSSQESSGRTLTISSYHNYKLVFSNNNYKIYEDDTQRHNKTVTWTSGYAEIGAYRTDEIAYFDNVRIRKYATTQPTTTTQSEEVGPSPIAYWKFDEGTGTTTNDSSSNAINGSFINTPQWQSEESCINGKCLLFDSTSDEININSPKFRRDSLSVCAWINPSTTSSRQDFIRSGNRGAYATNNWIFSIESGKLRVYGDTTNVTTDNTILSANTWQHVCFTNNGSNTSIFLNGELTKTGSHTINNNDTTGERIGGPGYLGLIDELKIFPYALTANQIKNEYNLGAAVIIGVGAYAYPSARLDDSLVAHWSFDELQGQTVYDKYGSNNGTLGANSSLGSDDPTWKTTSSCKINGCLSFDGSDKVTTTDSDSVRMNQDKSMSFSAWIKPNTTVGYDNIIRYDDYDNTDGDSPTTRNLYLFRIDNGQPRFAFGGSASGLTSIFGSTTLAAGSWYHLVAVRDVTTNTASIYVNGRLVGSGNDITTGTWETTGQYPVIGALQNEYFDGLIDEVKVYDSALTPEQIRQDMNTGSTLAVGTTTSEATDLTDGEGNPPVAEWKLDEKTGSTAGDTSGNGNTGTITGATWKSTKDCKQGACLSFTSSSSSYVTTSTDPGTMASGTYSLWVKPSTLNANMGWIDSNFDIFQWTGNILYFRAGNQSSISITDWTPDTWYHLALVWNGTNYYGYVNGKQVTSGTQSGSRTGQISIGRVDGGYYFTGLIDHVKIYNYARTPAQIAYDYNRGEPIAHWKMDECQGSTIHDSSDNGNHGTLTVTTTGGNTNGIGTCTTVTSAWGTGASGKFGASLNFDGDGDEVIVPHHTTLLPSSSFSISTWVKYQTGNSGYFITKCYSACSGQAYYLRVINNTFRFRGVSSQGNWLGSFDFGSLNPNTWYHVIVTYEGASATATGYINGEIIKQQDISSDTGIYQSSGASLYLGSRNNADFFSGQLDDVQIYNYVLSAMQVKKVMNEGSALRFGD